MLWPGDEATSIMMSSKLETRFKYKIQEPEDAEFLEMFHEKSLQMMGPLDPVKSQPTQDRNWPGTAAMSDTLRERQLIQSNVTD